MQIETLILGAGAAGMMCAAHAGPGTLVIDHAKAPGEKIRISGGGRCNFTNLGVVPGCFLSQNPHFAKSALARYTQWDFIELVSRHGIAWHEKTLGQLFCDGKATQIVDMLRHEMTAAGAELWLRTALVDLSHDGARFTAVLEREGTRRSVSARNLVLATGGRSIPKMGASGLACDIARRFGLDLVPQRPGLVPFTFADGRFATLAGLSLPVRMFNERAGFDEAMLFTHRGLSGPAVLQLSSYWHEGEPVQVDLLPGTDLGALLREARRSRGRRALVSELQGPLPARLVPLLAQEIDLSGNIGDLSDLRVDALVQALKSWELRPQGTEGYRTAEVTLGGISTDALSSKSMEAKAVPGLFAIGEAVDVTGWLGGYNFQWAWSSGAACGRHIAQSATSR
ncbi:aminoacetone oxidase family FAD-binding enzyme [Salipiger sp. 1_MG-2023]|uniref:NAD(P)/FAD-dependent oxidoreductase n=1 Tax=Salipiger sp. 1_MG-2023 TaxID=3062665 RepID=UPI0026E2EB13|nr:aminoacetone oxidase family FAD-binding enzyme [Salipiger sp. 1_MG-2023]MDO6586093.1 aminoacetone oxidase family FAD-binding enzyme [Salipiger sp. 1_MG-2023]